MESDCTAPCGLLEAFGFTLCEMVTSTGFWATKVMWSRFLHMHYMRNPDRTGNLSFKMLSGGPSSAFQVWKACFAGSFPDAEEEPLDQQHKNEGYRVSDFSSTVAHIGSIPGSPILTIHYKVHSSQGSMYQSPTTFKDFAPLGSFEAMFALNNLH